MIICKTFGAEVHSFARPPEATGTAWGDHVYICRRFAALAARVPHVAQAVLREAGESGDRLWASFVLLDPSAQTETQSELEDNRPRFQQQKSDCPEGCRAKLQVLL